jgi:hypothetical protein
MNLKYFLSFFRSKFYPVIGVIGLFIIHSCTEDLPEALFTDGMIRGHVSYYEGEIPYGIKVVASGPYGTKSALSDSSGLFIIKNLGNGTYELVFESDGYGSIHKYGIQVFGYDTIVVNATLYKMIDVFIMPEFIELYHSSSFPGMYGNEIVIETNVLRSDQLPDLRFFVDTKNTVSYKNYQYTIMSSPFQRNEIEHSIYSVDLYGFPCESGVKLYLKAYICNPDDIGYCNNYDGYYVYSTLDTKNCTATHSFTLP